MFFVLSQGWNKETILSPHEESLTKFFFFFFFISLLSSKLTISLISIYKCYTINIADHSSMQDACHMNFVIDLAHCGLSVAKW